MTKHADLKRDFAWIVIAYIVATAVGLAAAYLSVGYVQANWSDQSTLWYAGIADVAATLVIFAFSRAFNNSSFYDAYWSVLPPLLIGYWLVAHDAVNLQTLLVLLIVLLWAIRLTHNWARGWQGLTHVDWRYVDLKEKTGVFYPIVDLLGIQLFPTVMVFVGCVPIWLMVSQAPTLTTFQWLDLVWIVIGFAAVWLEFRADNVLRAHRLGGQGGVLQSDVWRLCRHPNYLGELGFWLALGLAGYIGSNNGLAWAGFIVMLCLFVFISIPMIDKRQLANKPEYADYKKRVPSLIPFTKLS